MEMRMPLAIKHSFRCNRWLMSLHYPPARHSIRKRLNCFISGISTVMWCRENPEYCTVGRFPSEKLPGGSEQFEFSCRIYYKENGKKPTPIRIVGKYPVEQEICIRFM